MGRPKFHIDWNKVDRYLQAQCDGVAIASLLGIHPDTLYLRCEQDKKMGFSKYSAIKKSEGVELLRAKQFSVAMDGDRTMLVWLGKQYLNQKDRSNNEIGLTSVESTKPMIIFGDEEDEDKQQI